MATIIEIDGGLVNVVERSIRQSVPLADWLPLIEKRSPIYTPVLPTNTRAMWWNPTDLHHQKLMVLVEREPQAINMNLDDDIYDLSIPWTRFFFYAETPDPAQPLLWRLNDYRILWSNRRYSSEMANDMVAAFLPNVYGDARICFGSTGAEANQSIADRLDQTVNEFYHTTFNHDLTIRFPNGWFDWEDWMRLSRSNPSHWAQWTDWTSGNEPLYSWNDLKNRFANNGPERAAHMVSADPIPDVPLGATFGRVREWLEGMTHGQRARFLEATLQYRAMDNDAFNPDFG